MDRRRKKTLMYKTCSVASKLRIVAGAGRSSKAGQLRQPVAAVTRSSMRALIGIWNGMLAEGCGNMPHIWHRAIG